MISLNIIYGAAEVPDVQDLRNGFSRLNGKRRGRLDVRVFDGRHEDNLNAALICPARVYLDIDCAAFTLSPAAFELHVSTATARRIDVAECFVRSLEHHFPHIGMVTEDIRCALQEAIANAVIHGNLGLNGALRGSLTSLRVFAAMMEQRLNQPVYSRLPITIGARLQRGCIAVSVEDCGQGFDPDCVRPADTPAAGGMGLSIMKRCSRKLVHSRCGRRVTMTFRTTDRSPDVPHRP